MQGTACSASAALVVEFAGDLARVRVDLDDGVHRGTALVESLNPAEVIVNQLSRPQVLLCHQRLKLDDGRLVQIGGSRSERRERCALQRGDGCGGPGQGAGSELQCVTAGDPKGRAFRHRFPSLVDSWGRQVASVVLA